MPKLKSHRGAAKRFRRTGSGKLVRMKGHRSHMRRKKAPRVKRLYSRKVSVSPADVRKIKQALPYGAAR